MATTTSVYETLIKKTTAKSTKYVATKSDPLKLRNTTATTNDNNVLVRIPKGKAVTVMSYSAPSGWTAVKYGNYYGFVASQYLSDTKPTTSTTTSPSSTSSTTYTISPNPSATTTTNNNSSMASEKIKKVLKVVGIAAGVGVIAYGAYKFMQKKKMLPVANSGETKALNGVCKSKKCRKSKSKKSRRGRGKLTLR